MTFTLIDENAEDMLYATLLAGGHKASGDTEKAENTYFVHCRFFQIALKPEPDEISNLFADVDFGEDATLYLCSDGDLIVKWTGVYEIISEELLNIISDRYGSKIEDYIKINDFFVDYNWFDGLRKLRNECLAKLKKQTKQGKELTKCFSDRRLIDTLHKTLQLMEMQRTFRGKPHILIVEDQIFSQKILLSILKGFTCHVAENVGEALLLYMEKCPDIVFLDIELPDLSGHSFARFINKIDPQSYIVMVTGNQYEKDIKAAKENGVRGFIVKPYERESILNTIEQYRKAKKRRAS